MDPITEALPPSILSQEEEKALVLKLKDHYDKSRSDTADLRNKIDKWHRLYAAYKDQTSKKFPWEGASNYKIPLILSVIDSYHAKLVKAVFEVDPLWMTRARTPQGESAAFKAQWYLDYWADEMDLPAELDKSALLMLIEGTGVVKIDWVRRTNSVHQFSELSPELAAATNVAQTVVDYEGPELKPVSLRDFVMIPADSPSIEEAVYVGHIVWRTRQQLEQSEAQGYYFNTQQLFDKSRGDVTYERQTPNAEVRNSSNNTKYTETNQFEIVELYGPYEWEPGNPQPTVFTFSPRHRVLLRIEPYFYSYGKPPYIDFVAFPQPNEFYGRSMAALLESAQEELTTIHNLRMDAVTRTIAPPILKKFGSPWDESKNPLTPNSVIPVNDVGDIRELLMRDIPGGLFAHENDLMAFVERTTGMSDFNMGRMNNQHATATAVNRVTSEGLNRVDVAVSRYQVGLKRLGWFLWWLLYQYRPFMDYFFAENTQMSIVKWEMRPTPDGLMPFELIPQGMLSDVSKESLRQQKLMMFQIASATLAQHYPDGLQKLLDDILKAHDVQDRASIIGPPWSLLQQQLQQAFQMGVQQGTASATQQPG